MITFQLPMPPSVNSAYRNGSGGRYYTSAARSWIQEAGYALNRQQVPAVTPPYHVTYSYGRFADKRRRDVGNYEKLLSDLLVKSCVLVDDSLIDRAILEWSDDVEPGQVRVSIIGQQIGQTSLNALGVNGERLPEEAA